MAFSLQHEQLLFFQNEVDVVKFWHVCKVSSAALQCLIVFSEVRSCSLSKRSLKGLSKIQIMMTSLINESQRVPNLQS